jgi:hypothetical protein
MTEYRLDPKNLPRLTDEEARRLAETPIDYSDIPPLGDEFFTQAKVSRTTPMLYEIKEAVPHPDHTVTVTWSDGAHAKVSFVPFLEKGGAFEALKDPDYFVREMRLLRGGIGLTWPNEVDFSADGLRQSAFPADPRRGWVSWPPLADEDLVFALLLEIVCRHAARPATSWTAMRSRFTPTLWPCCAKKARLSKSPENVTGTSSARYSPKAVHCSTGFGLIARAGRNHDQWRHN